METGKIYSLNCPKTGICKYIGQTIMTLEQRLKNHLRQKTNSKKFNWILSLRKNNLIPVIELIDEVPFNELNFWEQHYISLYRSWGFDLKNMTSGGSNGMRHSVESRKKIGDAWRGRKHSDETKNKIRIANKHLKPPSRKGVKLTEEQKKKLSEITKLQMTPEAREKIRQFNLGRKQSVETIQKRISKISGENHWNYGGQRTKETKMKMSLARKGKKWSIKQRIAYESKYKKNAV